MSSHKNKLFSRKIFLVFIVVISIVSTSFVFQSVNSVRSAGNSIPVAPSSNATSLYLVQFQESGLPSAVSNQGYGFLWAVKVSGQIHESSSSTIAIYMQQASNISYSVISVANYTSTPSSGTFNVTSSNVVLGISFTPTVYQVSFSETGLPTAGSSTEWKISFNGNTIYSNSSVISLTEPNGKYSYTVSSESIYLPSPSSGSVVVNGSSIVIPVQFTNNLESVTFFETGLPTFQGATESQWTVDLSNSTSNFNATQSSFNNSITFTVPSGNYSYLVSPVQSYNLIGGNGVVDVANKFTSVNVAYMTTLFGVEFQEFGLPSVIPIWSVSLKNLTSGQVTTDFSTQTSIYFNVTNGNYHFNVSSINGYNLLPASGYVNVSNGFYIINVKYISGYGTVTFKEKGLFSNTTNPSSSFGSYWSVTMINSTGYHFIESTDGSSITFWLPFGTYIYYTSNNTGFTPGNETGSVQLTGKVTEHVTYTLSDTLSQSTGGLAAINLYEIGLPAGTYWSVALSNDSRNATSQITRSALVTYYKPSGSYYIRILDSGYMHPNPSYIYVTVNTATQTSYNYTINFKAVLGYLNFTESGLLHGTQWSVAVNDSTGTINTYTSSFANLSIPLTNGTYFYMVQPSSPNVNPFGQATGFVYISSTHSASYHVSFFSNQYSITFNERGLPQGQPWQLILMNQSGSIVSFASTTGQINIPLINGTYRISAISSSGQFLAYPSLTAFNVNGSYSSQIEHNFTFVPNTLDISFVEVGLPTGTQWSVSLNGEQEVSSLDTVSFSLPGGTYIYHLTSTGQYSPTQSIGVVSVGNDNKTIRIDFVSIVNKVTFQASSLPSNLSWSVFVDGQILETSNQSLSLYLPNGTYQYQAVQQGYYYPGNPYGLFTVSGTPYIITINFVSIQYIVTFKETGLPSGVAWTMQIFNQTGVLTAYTSANTYNNVSLLNGSYSFNMLETDFYVSIPGNGTFSVSGAPLSLSVQYEIFTYQVTFSETGLPNGNTWNITLTSQYGTANNTSTTSDSASFKVVNGTYSYKIVSLNKSVKPSPMTGTLNVEGATVNIPINFSQVLYTAQVQEVGLNKNVSWSIEINNVIYTSKNTSINVTLVNGTYDFSVLNVTSGYTFSPENGKLIIKGANISTRISYSLIVTIIHPQNTTKANYNTFIVLGTLIGIGVIGLGVIVALYYQRKKS